MVCCSLLEVKFQNIDFNDETPLEINNAMAIILNDQHPVYYGDDLITGFWDFSVDNPNFTRRTYNWR